MYDKIKVPVYFKCGWAPGGRWTAPAFNAMNSKELTVYKRTGVMEGYSGMELPYRFMDEECLRWYDHWLKGIDTVHEEPPIKLNIIGRGYRYEKNGLPYGMEETLSSYLGQLWWRRIRRQSASGQLHASSAYHHRGQSLVYRTGPFEPSYGFHSPIELHLFASIDKDANLSARLAITLAVPAPISRTGLLKASYPLLRRVRLAVLFTIARLRHPGESASTSSRSTPLYGLCTRYALSGTRRWTTLSINPVPGKMSHLGPIRANINTKYTVTKIILHICSCRISPIHRELAAGYGG